MIEEGEGVERLKVRENTRVEKNLGGGGFEERKKERRRKGVQRYEVEVSLNKFSWREWKGMGKRR